MRNPSLSLALMMVLLSTLCLVHAPGQDVSREDSESQASDPAAGHSYHGEAFN